MNKLILLVAAILASALATPGSATPIQYTMTFGTDFVNPSINERATIDVVIGSNSYDGLTTPYTIQLTFTGDDSNVISAFSPVAFSAIDQGVATVTVLNGTQVLQTATFLPNQVVVTADNSNDGFGFGFVPGGVGAGGFDPSTVQPVYPAAISPTFVGGPAPDQFYNLTLAYAQARAGQSGSGFSYGADGSANLTAGLWSCYGFQETFGKGCSAPVPIQTDQGAFSIVGDVQPWYATFTGGNFPLGVFTAKPLASPVPEPASLALLGVAFAAMGWARRRKPN